MTKLSVWVDKLIMSKIPMDYKVGFIDGFKSGCKFSKDTYNDMYKAILSSEKVDKIIRKEAEKYKR